MKKRLDLILVDQGLAPSKTKAQDMIAAKVVEFSSDGEKWSVVEKKSQNFEENQGQFRLKSREFLKYVSRGGNKLEHAIKKINLQFKNRLVLDVGQSKGGFTDCALQFEAKPVTGVDVAEHELARSKPTEPRVVSLTATNARGMRDCISLREKKFDIVLVDLSFISLTKVLDEIVHFVIPGGELLCLVKPQFELGLEHLDKNAVPKNLRALSELQKRLESAVIRLGLDVLDYFPSALTGKDGNQEYFLYAKKPF